MSALASSIASMPGMVMPAMGTPGTGWAMGAVALSGAAVLGSCLAAARPSQPVAVRMAHVTMAAAMLPMLLPMVMPANWATVAGPAVIASLVALALVAGVVTWQLTRSGTGLACLIDLIGMALVLALVARTGQPVLLVVLVATGWAVSSLWVRWEQSLRQRTMMPHHTHGSLFWDGLGALVAATAMATMALAMAPS